MKGEVAPDPAEIRLLGAAAEVPQPHLLDHTAKQTDLTPRSLVANDAGRAAHDRGDVVCEIRHGRVAFRSVFVLTRKVNALVSASVPLSE